MAVLRWHIKVQQCWEVVAHVTAFSTCSVFSHSALGWKIPRLTAKCNQTGRVVVMSLPKYAIPKLGKDLCHRVGLDEKLGGLVSHYVRLTFNWQWADLKFIIGLINLYGSTYCHALLSKSQADLILN